MARKKTAKSKPKARHLPRLHPPARDRRVTISFRVDKDDFAAIVAAARELKVGLETFCGEAILQWVEEWRGIPAPQEAPIIQHVTARDVLDVATAPPRTEPPAQVNGRAVADLADDADDDDGDDEDDLEDDYAASALPTGEAPKQIGTAQDDDDDEPEPTVMSARRSPFHEPNPAGIKWRQGKDYGRKTEGHDWVATKPGPR
jgi:hypothetical protein